MPLKIKHIFRTDLDPNNNNWWSKDKIDKLNLNFNLLGNGGMPGPMGSIGVDGNFGLDGAQGPQGPQGHVGDIGATGAQGISPWTEGSNAEYLTLFPNFQGEIEYQPLRVGLGQLDSEQVPINYQGPLHILHNHESSISNLIINSPNSLDFHFRLSPISINSTSPKKMEIGNLDGNSNLILEYDLDSMDYKLHDSLSSTNYLLEINASNLILRSEKSVLGINNLTTITANGNFIYEPGAIEDKILVSLDAAGNSVWKNKAEVFGTLPVGAIISITSERFNNINFHLDYTENIDPSQKLDIIYGRGRENTPFEGWYLANGQTWTDGVIQYNTPNLNSFDFAVDSNGDAQDQINGGDNNKIIIGGADLLMQSTYLGSGEYQSEFIEETYDPSDYEITLNNTSGSFDISRNVHIVYLKELNYFWQTGDVSTIPTTDITLSIARNTADGACAESSITYQWTGDTTDWVNGNMTGISLYKNDLSPAIIGWYAKEGLARYWNGNSFTSSAACEITYNFNLATSSDVTQLNGTLSISANYTIDTPEFENATVLLSGGSNAPAGWYRETNNQFGWRRYWSGTQFLGESFELPYIFKAGVIGASTSSNSNACSSSQLTAIYYITGNATPSGITELHKINSTGSKVLVHLNWDGIPADGTKPLVSIYTQNAPSTNTPYRSLTDSDTSNTTYRATITTTSGLNAPIECAGYTISGTTTVNNSQAFGSGTITVSNAPVILVLTAFGGAGSISSCFTNGEINISGVGTSNVSAGAYETNSVLVQIGQNGTFSYTLTGTFGCNSGNYVTIS